MENCCRATYESAQAASPACPDTDAGYPRITIATSAPLPGDAPPPRLAAPDDRDARVLSELGRDAESRVAFTGLKRRLGVHQQVLARTLRRLEESGWVRREEGGYRLTEDGYAALKGVPRPKAAVETLAIVQALLPPHARADDVAARMERRWFAGLRWYGRSEAPGEITLTWLNEHSGIAVRVRLAGHALNVEAEVPQGDEAAAYAALKPLLAALAEVYETPKAARVGSAAPALRVPKTDIRGMAG